MVGNVSFARKYFARLRELKKAEHSYLPSGTY
jgi:hypothetical protein